MKHSHVRTVPDLTTNSHLQTPEDRSFHRLFPRHNHYGLCHRQSDDHNRRRQAADRSRLDVHVDQYRAQRW